MGTKITFLGTAGNSSVYSRQIRASGGIVFNHNDLQFHIDPGPGSLVKAKEAGIDVRETTAILCSHAHNGHAGDLNNMISAMTLDGEDKKGVLVCNKTVITGTPKIPAALSSYHKSLIEKYMVLEPGQKVAIEDIEIRALHAKHSDEHTIGFKIFTPKLTFAYTSDTEYFKELASQFKEVDILVLNVLNPFMTKSKILNSDDVVNILQKARPKMAILNHFGLKILKENPLYQAREIQKRTGIQTIEAKDGLVIAPQSYSTKRQKTLGFY